MKKIYYDTALSQQIFILLIDMELVRQITNLLHQESKLWELVRNKWIHTTLHAGSDCNDHDIWEGAIWLYSHFDQPLKELQIIDNPYQFTEAFERFADSSAHDYGLSFLLSRQASFSIFWPLIGIRIKGNIDWSMRNAMEHILNLRRLDEEGIIPNVMSGIKHGLNWDGALHYDFSKDCLLAQCDHIALVDFLIQCEIVSSPDIEHYIRFLSAGTFLSRLSTEHAAICKRPKYVKTSGDNLHCFDGPAIEWGDGSKWYFLNNIRVPEEVITVSPDDFDPQIMLQTKNAEVRKEIVSKIGIDKLIGKLNGQVLNRWDGYELIKLSLPYMQIAPIYLKMTNPSTGTIHIEGVPSDITSCKEALSWRVGWMGWNPEQLT